MSGAIGGEVWRYPVSPAVGSMLMRRFPEEARRAQAGKEGGIGYLGGFVHHHHQQQQQQHYRRRHCQHSRQKGVRGHG